MIDIEVLNDGLVWWYWFDGKYRIRIG